MSQAGAKKVLQNGLKKIRRYPFGNFLIPRA
jgi:hypothetical protein